MFFHPSCFTCCNVAGHQMLGSLVDQRQPNKVLMEVQRQTTVRIGNLTLVIVTFLDVGWKFLKVLQRGMWVNFGAPKLVLVPPPCAHLCIGTSLRDAALVVKTKSPLCSHGGHCEWWPEGRTRSAQFFHGVGSGLALQHVSWGWSAQKLPLVTSRMRLRRVSTGKPLKDLLLHQACVTSISECVPQCLNSPMFAVWCMHPAQA